MSVYRDKKSGRYLFQFDREIEGKRVRTRKLLPATRSKAQADAFDRKETARLYALASCPEREEHSIADAVAVYLRERAPNLKTHKGVEKELGLMYWVYKGRPLTDLPDVCKEYAKKANKETGGALAPATIRNRIRYLTSACRYAWKIHRMCEHDPAERVIAPTVRNSRQFTIDRADMVRLCLANAHRPTRQAIRIAFYSGMRMGEILQAKVRDGMFVLADTKNGSSRHVPVHPRVARCAGKPLPDQSTISRHFRAARKKVDMDWLHFHDLRHSAASQMINSDGELFTVGAVLGHRSYQSTQRYAHLATASLSAAVAQIGRRKAA